RDEHGAGAEEQSVRSQAAVHHRKHVPRDSCRECSHRGSEPAIRGRAQAPCCRWTPTDASRCSRLIHSAKKGSTIEWLPSSSRPAISFLARGSHSFSSW